MKKLIVAIHIIAAVGLAGAADLVVPKTDERTILRQPLDEGRLAYRDLGNGTATLAVGQAGSAHPLTVVDPLSLRGWRHSVLQKAEYAISWTSGFTYDGVNDKYTLGATTGVWERITITVMGNRTISNVDYTEVNITPGTIASTPCAKTRKTVTDTQIILEAMKTHAGDFYIQTPIVYGLVEGSTTDRIDLNDLHINIIDSIGPYELSRWRAWARDLYNGNRGVDWSHYKARENVYMLENKMIFGPTNLMMNALTIGTPFDEPKAVDFISNGGVAMRIGPAPSSVNPPAGATITNLSVSVTNTSTYVVVQAYNFPGFDPAQLKLFWTEQVDRKYKTWQEVPFTYTGTNPYTLVTPTKSATSGFYLTQYGTATAYIEVKCPMKVHDFRIVGTDNKIYQITVNAGVITATEIVE